MNVFAAVTVFVVFLYVHVAWNENLSVVDDGLKAYCVPGAANESCVAFHDVLFV